ENWQERLQSMAQGGFVNVALPVVQEGANKVLDALYSRSEKGLPIDREIKNRQIDDPDLQKLADENALARVKRKDGAQAQAKVPENSVVIDENASSAVLAHELM